MFNVGAKPINHYVSPLLLCKEQNNIINILPGFTSEIHQILEII